MAGGTAPMIVPWPGKLQKVTLNINFYLKCLDNWV